MTKQPIGYADPQLATRNLLRALLASREDAVAEGATVSTRGLPGADGTRTLPYIQVRSDGRTRDARYAAEAVLRVVVWHDDEGKAEALASLAEALLLSATAPAIRGFSPLAGPIPTGDPDTGLAMSFLTITARLRPSNI